MNCDKNYDDGCIRFSFVTSFAIYIDIYRYIYLYIDIYLCMPPTPTCILSVLLAPCSVSPRGCGASWPFEVSLQLQGLTPQVSR